MRTTLLAIVAGTGLLFSAAALADDASQPAPMQTASTSTAPALICRAVYHEGMLLTRAAQCHSQRYWDMIRHQQQEELMQLQLRGDLQMR